MAMSKSSSATQAPVLKGAWSDAEKLALLVSMIRASGPPKWSNGIAVPQGRTLQACAKMYAEILKASANVKMTEGDAVTPSGKRPRLGNGNGNGNSRDFDDDENFGTTSKKRKTAGAKNAAAKKGGKEGKKSMLADYDENWEDGDDDESLAEGKQEEDKIIIKKEIQEDEEEEKDEAV